MSVISFRWRQLLWKDYSQQHLDYLEPFMKRWSGGADMDRNSRHQEPRSWVRYWMHSSRSCICNIAGKAMAITYLLRESSSARVMRNGWRRSEVTSWRVSLHPDIGYYSTHTYMYMLCLSNHSLPGETKAIICVTFSVSQGWYQIRAEMWLANLCMTHFSMCLSDY